MPESNDGLESQSDESQAASKARPQRFTWNKELEQVLVEELLDQHRAGKRAEGGFKKEAWNAVVSAVYLAGGKQPTVQQVKSKFDWFKAMWRQWNDLYEASGFGWDEKTELFTASEEVWERYCAIKVSIEYYINCLLLILLILTEPQRSEMAKVESTPTSSYIR
jgi:Myb/SANT-like DNA-binding protein